MCLLTIHICIFFFPCQPYLFSFAGEYIGGCNDGNPGLLPLARENDGKRLNEMLENAGVSLS